MSTTQRAARTPAGPQPRRALPGYWAVVPFCLLTIVCSSPPAPEAVSPPPRSTTAAPAPKGPFWRPIKQAPRSGVYELRVTKGWLVSDYGGWRWLFPDDGQPARASQADRVKHQRLIYDPSLGVVAIGRDRHLRLAPKPLAPWRELGPLPDGVEPAQLSIYRGALVARSDTGILVNRDLLNWQIVPRFEGRRVIDALIDGNGVGIAVFSPQAIAVTADGGKNWTPLDDTAVYAQQLIDHGARIVVGPGDWADKCYGSYNNPALARCVRDLFADRFYRQWQKGSSTLKPISFDPRSYQGQVATVVEPRRRYKRTVKWWSQQPVASKQAKRRDLARIFTGRAAIAGDTVVTIEGDTLVRKPIGGSAKRTKLRYPKHRNPEGKCEWGQLDACALRVVHGCRDQLWYHEPDRESRSVQTNFTITNVAFSSPSTAVVFGEKGSLAGRVFGLARFDSTEPVVERLKLPDELRTATGSWALHGACQRDAPVWLVKAPRRKHPSLYPSAIWRFDPITVRFKKFEQLPSSARIVGFDERNRPVFLGTRARFGPLDYEQERWHNWRLPFTPLKASKIWLGSLRAGRGLLLGQGGNAYVTVDGGKTWRATTAPLIYGSPTIVCGEQHCEIQDVATSRGWQPPVADSAKKAKPKLTVPEKPSGTRTRAKRTNSPLKIVCEPAPVSKSPPRFGGKGRYYSLSLGFGLGRALYTGLLTVSQRRQVGEFRTGGPIPETDDRTRLYVLHGMADGTVQRRQLGFKRNRNTTISPAYYGPTYASGHVLASLAPLVWSTGPKKPLRRTPVRFAGVHALFTTPKGMALVGHDNRKVVLLRADGTSEFRVWPGAALPLLNEPHYQASESLVELTGGTWLILRRAGRDDPLLQLAALKADGSMKHRVMSVADSGLATLTTDGTRAYLVTNERCADGQLELRSRPVMADLRLGPPTSIAGTRRRSGEPWRPPPCVAEGAGMLIEIGLGQSQVTVKGEQLFKYAEAIGQLRLTPKRACVRRTRISDGSEMILAADGRGAAVVATNEFTALPITDLKYELSLYRCKRLP